MKKASMGITLMSHTPGMQHSRLGFVLALAAAAGLCGQPAAVAASYRVLHSFCSKTGCPDGAAPTGGVIVDSNDNLFGVADNGGAFGPGVAFELTSGKKKFSDQRLHSFCNANCRDGRTPSFPLIRDGSGNLYGVTAAGGSAGGGVVFELMPGADRWTLKVLHAFCSPVSGTCKEGASPSAGLAYEGAAAGQLYDGQSPLYGTTSTGGALNGGTVFALSPKNGKWRATPLYAFCETSCDSGSAPRGGLILDSAGNIFGVTSLGGANSDTHNEGVVFELSPAGSKYDYTVIYDFCAEQNCTDGEEPVGGLALDASGNLYGTTGRQGDHDAGTLFELLPDNGSFDFQILHQFCEAANCTDGGAPNVSLTLDGQGDIFGTTSQFGNSLGGGTLFELTSPQSGRAYSVLYDFCSEANCADGSFSKSQIVVDQAGNLFGTTEAGGLANAGVVFEFTP